MTQAFTDSHRESEYSLDTKSNDRAKPFVLNIDRRIGDYFVERELGRGGMGIVHLARRDGESEALALKLLPSIDGASLECSPRTGPCAMRVQASQFEAGEHYDVKEKESAQSGADCGQTA